MYKPTVTDAVLAYYKGELSQYRIEYLELLLDVVLTRLEGYDALRIDYKTQNVEVIKEGALLRRVFDSLAENISLKKQ